MTTQSNLYLSLATVLTQLHFTNIFTLLFKHFKKISIPITCSNLLISQSNRKRTFSSSPHLRIHTQQSHIQLNYNQPWRTKFLKKSTRQSKTKQTVLVIVPASIPSQQHTNCLSLPTKIASQSTLLTVTYFIIQF